MEIESERIGLQEIIDKAIEEMARMLSIIGMSIILSASLPSSWKLH